MMGKDVSELQQDAMRKSRFAKIPIMECRLGVARVHVGDQLGVTVL